MIEAFLAWTYTHEVLLFWIAGLSLALCVASILALPYLASLIPQDYFSDTKRHRAALRQLHPAIYLSIRAFKNLVGWLLVGAGLVMLVLPGQGILTILMGLVLSDFPGKYGFERQLARNARVMTAINWLRARRGTRPLDPVD